MAEDNPHIGSRFSDFLMEQGLFHEAQAHALKQVLIWKILDDMERRSMSKASLAMRLNVSQDHIDLLLDAEVDQVDLNVLCKVSHVLGREVRIEFE